MCNPDTPLALGDDRAEWTMNEGLERLVYESRATGSTGSLTNLATILAESQRNNDRDNLTGVLAAHGERYIQVIEGSPATLDNLLRRLNGDHRHREVSIIGREPIPARRFEGWTMASAHISPAQAVTLDRLIEAKDPTPDRIVDLLSEALDAASVN